jgi:hypothetical protein
MQAGDYNMEKKGKYTTKKLGRPALEKPRTFSLTFRGNADDLERLARLRALISPRVEISQGKAISAALKLAEEYFDNR